MLYQREGSHERGFSTTHQNMGVGLISLKLNSRLLATNVWLNDVLAMSKNLMRSLQLGIQSEMLRKKVSIGSSPLTMLESNWSTSILYWTFKCYKVLVFVFAGINFCKDFLLGCYAYCWWHRAADTTERVPGHPDPGDEINRRKQDDRSSSYGYQWPNAMSEYLIM